MLGTGLTMVDSVLLLLRDGHQEPIIAMAHHDIFSP